MDLQLPGRRAVVTGASRGIGPAVADSPAAEGARGALRAGGRAAHGRRRPGADRGRQRLDARLSGSLVGSVRNVAAGGGTRGSIHY